MPNPDKRCAVGIDVGGTKIAAGLVAFPSGRVLSRRKIATRPERGGEAVLTDALALVEELIGDSRDMDLDFVGVGVGVAELVDREGRVTSDHTIAWRGIEVGERFGEFGPVVIDADVRTAALGEAHFGSGVALGSFVYVSVGTGIGSCLVRDGRPWAGARGNALIMASSPLTTVCTECNASTHPILEEFASGAAIVKRFKAAGGRADSGEGVFDAAGSGNEEAIGILVSSGNALGVSIAFLVNVLDPDAIVVGGGIGLAGGVYWDRLESSMREHIWAESSRTLPIVEAGLGVDSGFVGAAARIGGDV